MEGEIFGGKFDFGGVWGVEEGIFDKLNEFDTITVYSLRQTHVLCIFMYN